MSAAASSEPQGTTTDTLWTYPHGLGRTVMADLDGYQVLAEDGAIGHVDRATDEIDGAAIVVDVGFWIFGKKRMIPAGVIDRIDAEDRTLTVVLTKDDIKHAPDYIGHDQSAADVHDLHRQDVSSYYKRWWR